MIETARQIGQGTGRTIDIRIGMNNGPAIAGVIGRRKPFFDVWGDTINVASRMESTGLPGRIQTTSSVKVLLHNRFHFEERGRIDVKGKGWMTGYLLTGRK